MDQFIRTKLLYGEKAIDNLKDKHIAIFGIGGVGGEVCESLIRSGIYNFTLIDNDLVSLSNLNRQIIATYDSLGKYKVDVMKERMLSINKLANIKTYKLFVLEDTINQIDFSSFDYIVDAIDTVSAKIALIKQANELNIPIISSMGAANKLNPMMFEIKDINQTEIDPLAKVIRHELRKNNILHLKVAFSKEKPLKPLLSKNLINELNEENNSNKKRIIPASNAIVPKACGLLIASEVLNDLCIDKFRIEEKDQ